MKQKAWGKPRDSMFYTTMRITIGFQSVVLIEHFNHRASYVQLQIILVPPPTFIIL